jgi:hypothetical protein
MECWLDEEVASSIGNSCNAAISVSNLETWWWWWCGFDFTNTLRWYDNCLICYAYSICYTADCCDQIKVIIFIKSILLISVFSDWEFLLPQRNK